MAATTTGELPLHDNPPKSAKTSPLLHEHDQPLKIAIIGAGIGGLSAAIGFRRAGHTVDLYEQSRFANEIGAAVHMAPNSNGLLRRWGIKGEEIGATNTDWLREFRYTGGIIKDIPLFMGAKRWQHPWQLVHRVALHDKLKKLATGPDGQGPPASLHTTSKVVDIDAAKGVITLGSGEKVTADLVVGADGIYSTSRKYITGKDYKLFSSGKAAFRFLLPRQLALDDPVTKPLVEKDGSLCLWYADDRRVVCYPCNNNETLNFVLIHPDTESHATQSDEWSKVGSVDQVLKVYKDFAPDLKQLITKVNPDDLKVWQLLDMEPMPTFCNGKLCVIGDAAHPFTPHQGQGAGQAMEDAVALAIVLPKGTAPEDVPERLQVYDEIRRERAHTIQEFSRLAGKDWQGGKPPLDMTEYSNYNFGHDENDYATDYFNRWLQAKHPTLMFRSPLSFGPFPGPRQDVFGRPQPRDPPATFTNVSVRFRTSRTYLQTLFPTRAFRFKDASTVCEVSWSLTTLDGMAWLGGTGYSHFGLYLHGAEYVKKDGGAVGGTFIALLMEDLADPIVSGRDELGMPKLFCDLDVKREGTSGCEIRASWRGATFAQVNLADLKAVEEGEAAGEAGTAGGDAAGQLVYRYVPAVGQPGKADAEYAVYVPLDDPGAGVKSTVKSVHKSQSASIKITPHDMKKLPTLHHIAVVLEKIPVYGVVEAKIVEGTGVTDLSSIRRIE